MKKALSIILLAATTACGGGDKAAPASGSGTPAAGGLTIAVIPKGTTHTFWQSIRSGAERAGKELGVTIIWRGPLREDDRDSQVSEVEGFGSWAPGELSESEYCDHGHMNERGREQYSRWLATRLQALFS